MTGQEMYERFAELMLRRHACGMDTWDQLDATDRDVWNVLADEVMEELS